MAKKKISEIDMASISTIDLIDEVMIRCHPAIFIGHKDEGNGGPNIFWHWTGNDDQCFALTQQLGMKIQMEAMRDIIQEENRRGED